MKLHSRTILVADDDSDDIEMIKESILEQDTSFTVEHAGSGIEALHYLEHAGNLDALSLVILDFKMPAMTGAEVLRKIKGDPRFSFIPVVMWSTSSHLMEQMNAEGQIAAKYFTKPNRVTELREITREMLGFCRP
jgi:CheY-like chemotaxis protein